MGSHVPQVPGLVPFWLLLVVLSLQVLGTGGRPLHAQGGRSAFRGKRAGTGACNSDFDLYFVLDISGSVNGNWLDVYYFVEDLVNKFKNPKLRVSFILYSTEGTTLMPLTSDREKIRQGLAELKKVVPEGSTYMQEGLKRANEQIEKETQGGKMVSSMIIAFTDGTLEPNPYEETKYEAQRARLMGATVYAVGVKDFNQSQLEGFADTKDDAFGVMGGFSALQGITDRIAEKSCIYLTALEPSSACVGEEYTVVVRGSGLQNTQDKKSVICRFKFSDGTSSDETATSVEEKAIVCPGVELEEAGEEIFVEISLNKGKTFFSNNLKFTSRQCGWNHSPTPVHSTRALHTTKTSQNTPPKTPPPNPPEPPPETTMETTTETTTEMTTEMTTKMTTTEAPTVTEPESEEFPLIPVVACSAGLVALLLCCLCYLCRWPKKKPPPPPPEEKECGPQCSIVIFPFCGCSRTSCRRHMEGRCLFAPVRNPGMTMSCAPSPRLPPCREQVPFSICPQRCQSPPPYSQSSRMLPLIPPISRALPPCPVKAPPPKLGS